MLEILRNGEREISDDHRCLVRVPASQFFSWYFTLLADATITAGMLSRTVAIKASEFWCLDYLQFDLVCHVWPIGEPGGNSLFLAENIFVTCLDEDCQAVTINQEQLFHLIDSVPFGSLIERRLMLLFEGVLPFGEVVSIPVDDYLDIVQAVASKYSYRLPSG